MVTTLLRFAACGVLALGLMTAAPADAASSRVTYKTARVVRWVDGDTVVTTRGTVRLIGIDTPELHACGYAKATKHARHWAPAGSKIRLGNPKSVRNKDDYGRSLRYVFRKHRDIGLSQIKKGAAARYDSRDGLQWHPREARYHSTDARHANYHCGGSTSSSSGSYAPVDINTCPSNAPIKGNRGDNGWIYHQPGQEYYNVTNPEECFATAAAAEAAGYRASKV